MSGDEKILEGLKSFYCTAYEEQKEAADDDYLEYLEGEFNPDNVDWTSPAGAVRSFIKEIRNDRLDAEDFMAECGLTPELKDWLFGTTI